MKVMEFDRPLRCSNPMPCYLQEISASVNMEDMGYVKQRWTCCCPKIDVFDQRDALKWQIEGPLCAWDLPCCDVTFDIKRPGGEQTLGTIRKTAASGLEGFAQQMFTDADNFV